MATNIEIIDNIMGADISLEQAKMDEYFSGLLNTLASFRTQITAMQQHIRLIERTVSKTLRDKEKEKKLKQRQRSNKKPSGFALPSSISDELCGFMSKELGTLVARTDVTRFIIGYIKDKNLQNPKNRKYILPDGALKKLLGVGEDDKLSYFNLQKYMNQHFHKKLVKTETDAETGT